MYVERQIDSIGFYEFERMRESMIIELDRWITRDHTKRVLEESGTEIYSFLGKSKSAYELLINAKIAVGLRNNLNSLPNRPDMIREGLLTVEDLTLLNYDSARLRAKLRGFSERKMENFFGRLQRYYKLV